MENRRFSGFSGVVWPGNLNLFLFLLATVLSMELFLVHGTIGLNLSDEGFLWYGVERVFHGEVPVRDFDSYDPARYYWSALWFRLWKPGLLTLRFSETVLQSLGVFLALLAAKRASTNRWELSGLALVLVLWMYPYYKFADQIVPMTALYIGCRLAEAPGPRNSLISGIFVGFAGFIERQHEVYLFFSFLVLVLFLFKGTGRAKSGISNLLLGCFLGNVPLLLMFLLVKGFFRSYMVHMVRVFFWYGTTNIALPVPWPWKDQWLPWRGFFSLGLCLTDCFYLLVPFLFVACLFVIWRGRRVPVESEKLLLVACLVGLPYLHFAFSRADLEHLSPCIGPFWVAFFAIGKDSLLRKAFLALALVVTSFSVVQRTGIMDYLNPSNIWPVKYRIDGDEFHLNSWTASYLEKVGAVVQELKPGESLLLLPNLSAIYTIFHLKSPTWEIFNTLPTPDSFQRRTIQEMERNNVQWVVLNDYALDGRKDLMYTNSQPVVWDYIRKHYGLVDYPGITGTCMIFHRLNKKPGK
jgi:hypothetical protein